VVTELHTRQVIPLQNLPGVQLGNSQLATSERCRAVDQTVTSADHEVLASTRWPKNPGRLVDSDPCLP